MKKAIQIAGGGLAGLVLGIALRRAGVPVTVFEAGSYPRHRVCGEFMSGAGLAVLHRLGLAEQVRSEGRFAQGASFYAEGEPLLNFALPQPAFCISRHRLDSSLAEEFVRCGGVLWEKRRWQGNGERIGVVRATGRRVRTEASGWRWFGIKAHAVGVALEADLELHFCRSGYLGLARLPAGRVNACGLFRSPVPLPALGQDWEGWLRGAGEPRLEERMRAAEFDRESLCFVAGLPAESEETPPAEECLLGDAWHMIAPVTGNGMSLAMESGEAAAAPLVDYSAGRRSWDECVRAVRGEIDRRFSGRLRVSRWVQWALFQPAARCVFRSLAPAFPGTVAWLFQHTR